MTIDRTLRRASALAVELYGSSVLLCQSLSGDGQRWTMMVRVNGELRAATNSHLEFSDAASELLELLRRAAVDKAEKLSKASTW